MQENENPIVYTCEIDTYSPGILEAYLVNGIILLQGGGNFGDLWQAHQSFRERVIQDFPHKKIIQLPQSIFFSEEQILKTISQVYTVTPTLRGESATAKYWRLDDGYVFGCHASRQTPYGPYESGRVQQ